MRSDSFVFPPRSFPLNLKAPVTFDRAVTEEDLTDGQFVRTYEIRAMVDGQWKTLVNGTTIGHKKIDIFPAVTATSVRLIVTSSLGTVRIRGGNVYNGAAAK